MSRQTLVVISGLPGSGKSTLAEGIAKKLKMPLLSVDPIESSIIKSGFKRNFETGLAAYHIVETLASEQLKLGISVIIDAVSPVKEAREMWCRLAKKFNASLTIIECVLECEEHHRRIESRVRNIEGLPEVTWEDVENRREEYLSWEEERLVMETSGSREANLHKALDYLSKG